MLEKNIERHLILNIIYHYKKSLAFSLVKTPQHLESLTKTLAFLSLQEKVPEALLKSLSHENLQNMNTYLTEHKIHVLDQNHENYPKNWLQLADPPLIIYAKGDLTVLNKASFAVVGTRQISPYGIQVTKLITQALAKRFVIVSGLAKGVDRQAHLSCLLSKQATIAICACGLDQCYPSQNKDLFKQIEKNGCIVSEYPLLMQPLKHHFIARNRLIAGIAQAVFIPEAGQKSGSLVTAQQALDLGKDIYVAPGSIFSAQSKGCINLIRDGAICINGANDILDENEDQQQSLFENIPEQLSQDAGRLYQALGNYPMCLDDLAKHSQLPLTQVLSLLSELELENLVELEGGYATKRFI